MGDGVFGDWVPLMDYAARKGVSLSTLRRYIKTNKIKYRVEEGRYLLWDDGTLPQLGVGGKPTHAGAHSKSAVAISVDTAPLQIRLKAAESELDRAREEIAELKMLIAIYEEQMGVSRVHHD